MGGYQNYADAAFKDARRSLDPVWEGNQRKFDQSMVSRGFGPDSKGYRTSADTFNRGQSDAYNSAAFGAQQAGDVRMNNDRNFNENQRQYNATYGLQDRSLRDSRNQFDKSFRENKRQYNQGFGEDVRRYDAGYGEDQRRFNLGFGEDVYRNRRDFGEDTRRYDQEFGLNEMLQLDNVSRAYGDQEYRDAVFNASRDDKQMADLMSMMGFAPNGGAQPINMGAAFNNALVGDMNAADTQNQRLSNYGTAIGTAAGSGALGNWWDGMTGKFNSNNYTTDQLTYGGI